LNDVLAQQVIHGASRVILISNFHYKKIGKYSALFFIVISMRYTINFTPNTNTCFFEHQG